jgi:hypothetical protein
VQRRVQNQNMASLNRQFYARDEEKTPFLSIKVKVLIEGHLVMIGNGNDVKTFLGSLGDKFFGGVSYTVKRIFSGVKMQICLEGLGPFYFDH